MGDGYDDAINDIGTALMRLRSAFKKHGIPVPDALVWDDAQKGRDVEILLREHMLGSANYVMMSGGELRREASIAGFTMRHPATPGEKFDPNDYEVMRWPSGHPHAP